MSAHNLAADLRDLGELAAARDLARDTLDRRRQLLGEDHPDTLRSASNLARIMAETGQYQTAQELEEDTQVRRQRVLHDRANTSGIDEISQPNPSPNTSAEQRTE
jgi:hypothetical protein